MDHRMNWVIRLSELEIQRERLLKKHQKRCVPNTKTIKPNKLKYAFTRVLIAIIFVLISAIFINTSENNHQSFKKEVFETNLSFTKINEWYEKYFGKVLPIDINPGSTVVNKTTNEFKNIEKFHEGVSCGIGKGAIISTLNSGILVFLGEKENYGNVAIIQGIDGVDIWYGNIENINLSLYDYVEKDTLLGSAKEDQIYLVFQKEGQFLNYEEYKSQI